jgi:hypothetical protein
LEAIQRHYSHSGYFAEVVEATVATDGTAKINKVGLSATSARQRAR